MKKLTRNSPSTSESGSPKFQNGGYEDMARQRIMGCARETNQIMGNTDFFPHTIQ